ncbi:MAG: hypothetical protein AAB804_03480 [Patescibacteria group bacterium]
MSIFFFQSNGVRLLLILLGVVGTLFAPWWVSPLCMILLSLRYPAWEVPFLGLLIDLVWLSGGSGFSVPLFTIVGVCMVWILAPLREQFLIR